jgi:hypothetical protein
MWHRIIRPAKNLSIALILGVVCLFVLAPEVSAGVKLTGKIKTQAIKKSDESLWNKPLDHPISIGSREMNRIVWNIRYAMKLEVLWDKPERIFDKNTVARLSEIFRKKLTQVRKNEIIHFSINTPVGRTTGDVFVFNDAVNWRFSEIKGLDYVMDTQSVAQESSGEILVNWKLAPGKKQKYFYKENLLGMKIRKEYWITASIKNRKKKIPSASGEAVKAQEKTEIKEKLKLLKELKEENLISEQDYERKVNKLLEQF